MKIGQIAEALQIVRKYVGDDEWLQGEHDEIHTPLNDEQHKLSAEDEAKLLELQARKDEHGYWVFKT